MPTVHIPDKLFIRIIQLGVKDHPKFIRDAVLEKIIREESKQ